MNVFMVYAHQDPTSFGAALHATALRFFEGRGDKVAVSDLYGSGFQAVAAKWDFKVSSGAHEDYSSGQRHAAANGEGGFAEDIRQEMARLRAADLVILEFPVWWSAPPAILKGWLDKVFALGVTWDADHRYASGFMNGKHVLVVGEVGDPQKHYTPEGIHRASLTQHMFPLLHSTLAQVGLDVHMPYFAYNTALAGEAELQEKIDGLDAFLKTQMDTPQFIYKHNQ